MFTSSNNAFFPILNVTLLVPIILYNLSLIGSGPNATDGCIMFVILQRPCRPPSQLYILQEILYFARLFAFKCDCFIAAIREREMTRSSPVSYTHLQQFPVCGAAAMIEIQRKLVGDGDPVRCAAGDITCAVIGLAAAPVSYTHLDVYKRQTKISVKI